MHFLNENEIGESHANNFVFEAFVKKNELLFWLKIRGVFFSVVGFCFVFDQSKNCFKNIIDEPILNKKHLPNKL